MIFVYFRLVTPYSILEVRVMVKISIRSDQVAGSTKIDLYKLLSMNNGQCKSFCIL